MNKVSVIIPTYNCKQYLNKALSSVVEQSHRDLEVIVIDDNSNDGSDELLQYWASVDSRIKVLNQPGLGASMARNIGIAQATGDYIAFLDADDFWLPNKIVDQLELHQFYPEIALSFTNYNHLTESYQEIIDCFGYWDKFQSETRRFLLLEQPLDFIIANNIIGTSTVMVKTDVLKQMKPFDSSFTYCEDWELWLRICEKHSVAALNSVKTGYLMRQGSQTQSHEKRLANLACIENILEKYQGYTHSQRPIRIAQARLLEGYADYHRELSQHLTAMKLQCRSMFAHPQPRKLRSILGDCKRSLLTLAPACR
ncbi:glycosyltransferase family 2 protein [Vibrio sp. SCSIO 43135]|uniref:glycosyltransferase family 2 protein n=1 Tax=Vibrio sp. SCSIO 43135 TaxID=2819096 RepID=UPI00207554AE|nr:glycosyltransferase family 2 protein [Vibrio sp. SCSIO 43135]USD43542.1 glycosyltransferase family 2 protein [Vibrio sp. SCSIO 43135]